MSGPDGTPTGEAIAGWADVPASALSTSQALLLEQCDVANPAGPRAG
jgi:hypothetical protein